MQIRYTRIVPKSKQAQDQVVKLVGRMKAPTWKLVEGVLLITDNGLEVSLAADLWEVVTA